VDLGNAEQKPLKVASVSMSDLIHDEDGRALLLRFASRMFPADSEAEEPGSDPDEG
jgi:hypothetical protein